MDAQRRRLRKRDELNRVRPLTTPDAGYIVEWVGGALLPQAMLKELQIINLREELARCNLSVGRGMTADGSRTIFDYGE